MNVNVSVTFEKERPRKENTSSVLRSVDDSVGIIAHCYEL